MILDPFRLYRRHKRLLREAQAEALHLRRRHGDAALAVARSRLSESDLTTWGHRVMRKTIALLAKS